MKTFHCLKSFHSLQDQVQTLCLTYSAFHNQALICNSSHICFRLPCSLVPPAHAAAKAKRLAIAVWSKVCRLKPQGLCICCPHTIWLFRIYPRSWSSALHGLLSFLEGSPLCLSPFQNFRSTSTTPLSQLLFVQPFLTLPLGYKLLASRTHGHYSYIFLAQCRKSGT